MRGGDKMKKYEKISIKIVKFTEKDAVTTGGCMSKGRGC